MNEHEQPESVARELAAREPIFHRPEFGTSRSDFDAMMVDDFWEVGASGQVYSRAQVLDILEQRHRAPVAEDFEVSDFACRPVGADTWLVTYRLLQQGNRCTRRSTLWRRAADGWKIVYHQGTLVQAVSGFAAA